MYRKYVQVAVAIATVAALLAGCAPGSSGSGPTSDIPKDGGTLTIAVAKDVYTLDPGRTNDLQSQRVYSLIFDTLVTNNKKFQIISSVAESWSDVGAKEWTFKLKRGIKFTDGTELTSEDVAYSFQRILDVPEAASQKRSKISMIERIETPDKYTVKFYLSFPYAPFLGAAAQHIVPKHVVESVGEKEFGRKPVGSGPFTLKEWILDDHVTLSRNETYWRAKPHLGQIVFRPIPDPTVAAMAAIAGEVDVVEQLQGSTIDKVKGAGVDVKIAEGMTYYPVAFRMYGPPYDNVKFRKMVYYSTDMDSAIAVVLPNGTGYRAYTPVILGVWPRDVEHAKSVALKQDKAKAKALFEELIAEGVMTKATPVVFLSNEDSVRVKLFEIMVTNLKEIGVNAQLKVLEYSAWLDSVVKQKVPCICCLGCTAAILDPDAIFNWQFSCGSNLGGNILGLKRSEIDDMLAQARTTTDRGVRETLYKKIEKWVIEENVYHIPAYTLNTVIAVNKRVHGLEPSPDGYWRILIEDTNVWVDPK